MGVGFQGSENIFITGVGKGDSILVTSVLCDIDM